MFELSGLYFPELWIWKVGSADVGILTKIKITAARE